MSRKKKTTAGRASLFTGASLFAAAAAALSGAPAVAQDAEDEEAIVVTGSRIARTDATSASPLTVVDSEDIQDAGIIGIGEILRQDPAIGSGGFGQANILSGGGAQTIDLRNMGPNRTLVLINGQRYSLFTDSLQNEGQDLGLLPAAMIERIEILRDGASTAYGADAVAGVVNFILRDDYEGLHITALHGDTDEMDGAQNRVSFLAGASSDRGGASVAMEWIQRDNIPQMNREWADHPFGGGINANPFATVGSGIGGPQVRATNGALLECFAVNGGGSLGGGPCARYNYALDQDIVSSLEGYNIAFSANYDITNSLSWHGTAIFGSRYSEFGLAANPFSANAPTGPYLTGVRVGAGEASNPYGQTVSITWRPVEYGSREQSFDAAQIWISTGFAGEIAENYSWDFTLTRSEVDSNGQTHVVPNVVRLSRLLNPSQCLADPVCNSPAIGAVANIQNLFNGTTPLTAGQQNYAFYTQSTNSRFITDAAVASISGPLFELPAGDLSFAAGLEYRSEYGKATPDSVTQSGESVANATFPTEGDFDTFEVFGELDIPLLADAPLAHELTLNLQGRHSDFSNFGEADTWKAGLVWSPIEDLRIRASMGTSFRAPNVTDLYSIGVQSFNAIADPCSTGPAGGISNGVYNDAAAAATCAALGVPLTYVQPAAQLRVLAGGNPNLTPEEGETWTVGFVYQPSYFTPLTVTLDYWNIELDNAIAGGGLQARLNDCYRNQPLVQFNPGGTCEDLGMRTAAGVPTNLVAIAQNAVGTSETSGVDASFLLALTEFGPGDLDLSLRTTWLETATGGLFCGANFDCVGFIDGNTNGGNGFPEWRAVFDAEYTVGAFTVGWRTSYMSDMLDPHCVAPVTAFCPLGPANPLGYDGPDAHTEHDLRFRYAHDNYRFTFGVNNVTDEDPELAISTGNNTYPGLYDVVGRNWFVGVSADF